MLLLAFKGSLATGEKVDHGGCRMEAGSSVEKAIVVASMRDNDGVD